MSEFTDVIFENYDRYLHDHKDQVSSPKGAMEMLSSDGAFAAYMNQLTEGLNPDAKDAAIAVCEREREMLLEESINVGPSSSSVIGYAVTYFPILTDIYSDPIISQIATVYPVNKSILTVPMIQITGQVKNSDGTITNYVIPRESDNVRGKAEVIALLPATSNDLFSLSPAGLVNSDNSWVNRRYFYLKNIKVANATPTTFDVPVMVRPDARGQLTTTFTFTDTDSSDVIEGSMIGNVRWDMGIIQYNITYANLSNPGVGTYTTTQVDSSVIFSARTGDIGRVKVKIEHSGWDYQ